MAGQGPQGSQKMAENNIVFSLETELNLQILLKYPKHKYNVSVVDILQHEVQRTLSKPDAYKPAFL